ncbi:MAG: hypothetical protein MSB11_06260 [Prevotella sp.]|nr:hypothetical protein [Prevotella sp.]
MEEKINIAKILKDKKNGLRLYSPIFGECAFCSVREDTNDICVKKHNGVKELFDSKGLYYNTGEVMLFPSKEMRDWEKFSWKKGDVLTSSSGFQIFFDKWVNEDYTEFLGKIKLLGDSHCYYTAYYTLASEEEALEFIKSVEEINNGKLNRETLEIEKQSEFKDGDIVVTDAVPSMCYSKCIFILKGDLNTGESRANSYVFFNINNNHISYDVLDTIERDRNIHLATDSEKQQLFTALEKEGKDWDSEHKMIVDFKPKFDELKPFDKVVVRCSEADRWSIDFFSYRVHNGYICTGDAWFGYCLPYNDETAHLLGTTDDWKGCEG